MTVFDTCDFPLLEDSEALERVKTAVASREPFSLIRIGDGEAVVLAFPDDVWLQDLAYLHGHWGAEGVTLGAIGEVKQDLQHALRNADIVGVRNDVVNVTLPEDIVDKPGREIERLVISAFHLRDDERHRLSAISARRLALLHRVLSKTQWSEDQRFCSAWIHWELLATGALNEILEGVTQVGLVTSRPELERLVAERFDVKARSIHVPDKSIDTMMSGQHVPGRYRSIKSEFTFPKGTLVLVGAGIPGKVYCQWLREMGCVAIDVGAVFDAWIGRASRPRVLESRFRIAGGGRVPPELQLRLPQMPQGRRLIPKWKPPEVTP